MTWIPISESNAEQTLETATERTTLDFKKTYDLTDPTKRYELGKDVVAFANNLGGTILIGVTEGKGIHAGRAVRFEHVQNSGELIKVLEAMVSLCRPVPVVVPEIVKLDAATQTSLLNRPVDDDVELLAINVYPLLATPIGAPSCDNEGKRIPDSYRFPIRTIEGTRYLRPEELAFHMNSAERRILLQLSQIRADERDMIDVWDYQLGDGLRPPRRCSLKSVEAESLSMTLAVMLAENPYEAEVPMTFVRAVWKAKGRWNIALEGTVFYMKADTSFSGFIPLGGMY